MIQPAILMRFCLKCMTWVICIGDEFHPRTIIGSKRSCFQCSSYTFESEDIALIVQSALKEAHAPPGDLTSWVQDMMTDMPLNAIQIKHRRHHGKNLTFISQICHFLCKEPDDKKTMIVHRQGQKATIIRDVVFHMEQFGGGWQNEMLERIIFSSQPEHNADPSGNWFRDKWIGGWDMGAEEGDKNA